MTWEELEGWWTDAGTFDSFVALQTWWRKPGPTRKRLPFANCRLPIFIARSGLQMTVLSLSMNTELGRESSAIKPIKQLAIARAQ